MWYPRKGPSLLCSIPCADGLGTSTDGGIPKVVKFPILVVAGHSFGVTELYILGLEKVFFYKICLKGEFFFIYKIWVFFIRMDILQNRILYTPGLVWCQGMRSKGALGCDTRIVIFSSFFQSHLVSFITTAATSANRIYNWHNILMFM